MKLSHRAADASSLAEVGGRMGRPMHSGPASIKDEHVFPTSACMCKHTIHMHTYRYICKKVHIADHMECS